MKNQFNMAAQKGWEDLLNQANFFDKFSAKESEKDRMRLMVSIYLVRWCAFQAVAFRDHNGIPGSINKGNFIEMLEAFGYFSPKIKELFRTPSEYASYTSPKIQKEILSIISYNVRERISDEIDCETGRFCLLVDKVRDGSHQEKMSVVLRFVNDEGFVNEHFFGLVNVRNTTTQTLKDEIYRLLSGYLKVKDIRGQGYDGANNMQGQFKDLQTLISNDCKYAYYVHSIGHGLQLALTTASQGVVALRKFFTQLSFVGDVVYAFAKLTDRPRDAQVDEIAYLIDVDDSKNGNRLYQIDILKRVMSTRWSSHLKSVSSFIKMFSPICEVLVKNFVEGNGSMKGDAGSAYETITTFEFVFVLHLEKEIMEITDLLCQTLQSIEQGIFIALRLVASTKVLLQEFKDEKWEYLLSCVKSFCQVHNIDIPDLSSPYSSRVARACNEHSDHTLEHHYREDIFNEAINCLLMELNHRFNDNSMELLRLSSTLDPTFANEPFRRIDVCQLVEKFYPEDFSDDDKTDLKMQLAHYEFDVVQHANYKCLTSISDLCRWLVRTRKSTIYDLVYRVIALVLTLPISRATNRLFSTLTTVEMRIQNSMDDDFLDDSLVLFIEREIAENVSLEQIVHDFNGHQIEVSSTLVNDV